MRLGSIKHQSGNKNPAQRLGVVLSMNLHRRHLSEGQRAAVAAKIANLENGQKTSSANLQSTGVSQSDAAEMLNVSTRTVAAASRVRDESPEVFQAVESGVISVNLASQIKLQICRLKTSVNPARHPAPPRNPHPEPCAPAATPPAPSEPLRAGPGDYPPPGSSLGLVHRSQRPHADRQSLGMPPWTMMLITPSPSCPGSL